MKIKEVERRVGITSANVRYYEKEGLLHPVRDVENNYREYTEADVERLKQIKVLRLIGIPLADIRSLDTGEKTLEEIVEERLAKIHQEEKNLRAVEKVCETILKRDMGVEMLDEEILGEDRSVWKERLEEVLRKDITKEIVTRKQLNRNMALMLGWGYLLNAVVAFFLSGYFILQDKGFNGKTLQQSREQMQTGVWTPRHAFVPGWTVAMLLVAILCGILVYWSASVMLQTVVFHINALLLTPLVLSLAGPLLRRADGTLRMDGSPNVLFGVYWLLVIGYVLLLWLLAEKWSGMFRKVRTTLGIAAVYGSVMAAVCYLLCGNLLLSAAASYLITLYIGMNWTTTVMDQKTYNRYYVVAAASRMLNVAAMFLHMKGRTYSFGRWKDHE